MVFESCKKHSRSFAPVLIRSNLNFHFYRKCFSRPKILVICSRTPHCAAARPPFPVFDYLFTSFPPNPDDLICFYRFGSANHSQSDWNPHFLVGRNLNYITLSRFWCRRWQEDYVMLPASLLSLPLLILHLHHMYPRICYEDYYEQDGQSLPHTGRRRFFGAVICP